MFLGACLDLGMPLEVIVEAVRALGLEGVELEHRHAQRGGITGSRFRVLRAGLPIEGPDPEEVSEADGSGDATSFHGEPPKDHGHLHAHGHTHKDERAVPSTYRGIADLVGASDLAEGTKARALAMLRRVGEAEAKVHGVGLDEVHFHELAALDSIVDIVGAAAAMEYLDAERVTCGTVVVGSGTVRTAHGLMPVPAPATALLLAGVPTEGGGAGELTTPTGALILQEFVDEFRPQSLQRSDGFGYGLGRKDLSDRANAVRLARGTEETLGETHGQLAEVSVIECQVDDVSGEVLGHVQEVLLATGALDVFLTPVQMKKARPGTLVTVLCRHGQRRALAEVLLRETGALGCRFTVAERLELDRDWETVSTQFGDVRLKVGSLDGEVVACRPEFEDCRRLAAEHGVALEAVYRAALAAREVDAAPVSTADT